MTRRRSAEARRDVPWFMFAFLEGPELLIVLAIVLLIFGSSQLPKLARSFGQAQKEFKSAINDDKDEPAPKQ